MVLVEYAYVPPGVLVRSVGRGLFGVGVVVGVVLVGGVIGMWAGYYVPVYLWG